MSVEEDKVIAVVVTCNRKTMLLECIKAILGQSFSISKLIIIDNASSDGTRQALKKEGYLENEIVFYVYLQENIGGAGGFYEGIKYARSMECDWVWVMDDDTIPEEDCLVNLIKASKIVENDEGDNSYKSVNSSAFFASTIYGPDQSFMNVPTVSTKVASNGYAYWYKYLKYGIVSILYATFVSVLIKKDAICKCGLPCKDFFIWGDDTEYTLRLSTFYGDGYFVGSSIAIHNRENSLRLEIENETDPQRIDRYHYLYRNKLIYQRFYNYNYSGIIRTLLKGVKIALSHCKYKPYGFRMAKAILRGYIEYIVQYKQFKGYIDGELNI